MTHVPDDPTQAQIWLDGEAPNQELSIYVPRGDKGDPGGITLGTSLDNATDLNSVVTPGVYRRGTAPLANLNYPVLDLGVLVVHQSSTAAQPWIIQEWMPTATTSAWRGKLFYRRVLSGGVWSPWQVYASQRVDQTAGRVIYHWDDLNNRDQMVYGDTGWRTVAVTPVAGKVLSGNVRYRRRDMQVELAFIDVLLDTANNGFTEIILSADVPVGFRPASTTRNQQAIGLSNSALQQQWIANYGTISWSHQIVSGVFSSARPSVALVGNVTWNTDEAWPTTLPGTAFGTIPNL